MLADVVMRYAKTRTDDPRNVLRAHALVAIVPHSSI